MKINFQGSSLKSIKTICFCQMSRLFVGLANSREILYRETGNQTRISKVKRYALLASERCVFLLLLLLLFYSLHYLQTVGKIIY